MSYQVPINNKDKIFLINRSDIQERFDAQFYKEHFNFDGYVRLNNFVSVQGGKRIPKGMDYCLQETPFLYLRVADIMEDSSVDYTRLRNIDDLVFKALERYELHNGELVISIAGTIGKVYFAKDIPINKKVILTENCAKLVVNDKDVLPEYLSIILQMPILKRQIELNYIQTTIPKMGLDRIGRLMIPPIPSVEKQREIIDFYYSSVDNRRQKYNESRQLLYSIDEYILENLGIALPKLNNSINDRIFTTTFKEVIGGRFDPVKVLYLGDNAKSSIFPNVKLKHIASIEKGQSITSDEVIEGPYPVIAGGQTSPYSHNEYNFAGNVITVSASGAYSGYVWYHATPIFASDCSVIQSKDEDKFMTKYIYEVLKAQQKQVYLLQQGAGQPHVYPDDLGKLWIPVVSLTKQQEIVQHITAIRQQAKALQEEGKAILEQAKKEVEAMIMYDKKN